MKKNKELKKFKRNRNVKILLSLIIVILALIILSDRLVINLNQREKSQIDISLPSQIINHCSSGDLFNDARCVNELTDTFYKYNISNVGKDLSFNELKEQGGTCEQWSNYYCAVGNKLGYYTHITSFKTAIETTENETYSIYHQFCLWSNELGYIEFDGRDMMQAKFAELNITELEKAIK